MCVRARASDAVMQYKPIFVQINQKRDPLDSRMGNILAAVCGKINLQMIRTQKPREESLGTDGSGS